MASRTPLFMSFEGEALVRWGVRGEHSTRHLMEQSACSIVIRFLQVCGHVQTCRCDL
jgi:hypothetical protein